MVERLTIVDENPDFTSDVGGSDRKNLIFDELQFEDDEEEEEDGMSTTGGQVKGTNFEWLLNKIQGSPILKLAMVTRL